jgi:uncharacterized protein HemY
VSGEYDGLPLTFAALCRAADERQRRKPRDPHLERLRKLMSSTVSLERAYHELNKPRDGAASSTVEALMYSLRERGAAALKEPPTQRRLAELSSAQVREVIGRLMRLRPRYRAITDELLYMLGEQL